MISIIEGDLFTYGGHVAHCVSRDFHMGAGIALLFKKLYGSVDVLLAQDCKIGQVASLKVDSRFIFYLVTKDKYYEKPTLKDLRSSLESLHSICIEKEIEEIAMPKIGCGLDKLKWNDVYDILVELFTNIRVIIYVL